MMKKITLSILIISSLFLFAQCAIAGIPADMQSQLNAAGQTGAGYTAAKDPRSIAASIIKAALGLLGMIFVILIIYAGFLWMTAGGEEEKSKKGRTLITQAVIGLVIVLAAYAAAAFVVKIVLGQADEGSERDRMQWSL